MKNAGALQVSVPTEREVVMTRVFDAPRRLVFDALTKPELFKRWFGPPGWSLAVYETDLKVGGAGRSGVRGPDGRERRLGRRSALSAPSRSTTIRMSRSIR